MNSETTMKDKILNWFATGRTGLSSSAVASYIAGIPSDNKNHPYDPADLNRCLLFLEAVPEARAHLGKLCELSPVWARYVGRWDELEALFLKEVGRDWCKAQSAPRTYALMREIRGAK